MEYQAFTNDSLCEGIRGVLAADDALEHREWMLDPDGIAGDPASLMLSDLLPHDEPKARKIQKADIRFGIGIAFAVAMPVLIGVGIYIAATVLISAS